MMPIANRKVTAHAARWARTLPGLLLSGALLAMPSVSFMATSPSRVVAQDQPNITPLFFTGVIGGDSAQGRRVLLRWYTVDDFIPLDSAVIYRTDGSNTREKISVVKASRNISVIKSVFYAPGAEAALADAQTFIEKVYGSPGNTPEEFAQRVVDFLDSGSPSQTAEARRLLVTQANYGFALIEGLGYLDHVDPANGPYTYELWQGDTNGEAVDALGQITLNVSTPDELPAPTKLREIFLKGRDGVTPARGNNQRIYLNWDVPPILATQRPISFGFNVYRLGRQIGGGETFESVKDELIRLNDVPILPPSPLEGVSDDQSYIFADDGDWLDTLDEGTLLPVGQTYTYFAVPRDLLGQEGEPSEPLVATVRDTFEPGVIHGVNVIPVTIPEGPRLEVSWLPAPEEDVVAYRIYRYQEYANSGKPGPFAPINGLTEGMIAEVGTDQFAPDEQRLHYIDLDVDQNHDQQVFWYSLAAVDGGGNESAISPSVFGSIDDVVGPTTSGIASLCLTQTIPTIGASVALEADGRSESWEPLFIINRINYLAKRVLVYRLEPGTAGGGPASEPVLIGDYKLPSNEPFFGGDGPDFERTDESSLPTYRFEMIAADGRTDSIDVPPPTWSTGSARAVYTVNVDVTGARPDCIPIAILEPKVVTVVPGFDQPPVQFEAPCTGDAEQVRLLRSVNGGRTWDLVSEVPCSAGVADLVDNYHPESLTRARYALVSLDESGNPGVPRYLPYDVMILGETTPPAPISADAIGNNLPGSRKVRIRWQGPADGIEFYRVHFRNKATLGGIAIDTTPTALEFSVAAARSDTPPADFTYDETTGIFEMQTSTVNRTGDPLDPKIEYDVLIEAVPYAGESTYGSRSISMHWDNYNINNNPTPGALHWAARPVPGVIDKSIAYKNVQYDAGLRGGSVLIPVTNNTSEFVYPSSEPPYMLWRKRTDKANQPWTAVTPFISAIHRTGNVVDDPFFTVRSNNIWLLDSTGVVQSATYRYYVMTFDKMSYEIEGLWGPYDFLAVVPGR